MARIEGLTFFNKKLKKEKLATDFVKLKPYCYHVVKSKKSVTTHVSLKLVATI